MSDIKIIEDQKKNKKMFKDKSYFIKNYFLFPFVFKIEENDCSQINTHNTKKEYSRQTDNEISYLKLVGNLMSKGWEYGKPISDSELHGHITSLISNNPEREENIGTVLKLKKLSYAGLPDDVMNLVFKKNNAEEVLTRFEINNINLILFKTFIGILVIDIGYRPVSDDFENIIRCNYLFKSTVRENVICKFEIEKERVELNVDKETQLTNVDSCSGKEDCKAQIEYKGKQYKLVLPSEAESCANSAIISKLIEIKPTVNNSNTQYKLVLEDKNELDQRNQLKSCNMILRAYEIKQLGMRDIIEGALKDLKIVTFFDDTLQKNKKNEKEDPDHVLLPKKALVFTFAFVDRNGEDERQLGKLFFEMRRSFKESYMPCQREFDFINNPEIYRAFENSFWGVSREGCANLVYKTDNEETDQYFTVNYPARLNNYFYLYILVLHQYFGLLNLARRASCLSIDINDYGNDEKYKQLEALRNDIKFFYLKCIFEDVSLVTHQNLIYQLAKRIFGIRGLLDELHLELEMLTAVIEQKRHQTAERIEQKKARRFRAFAIAGALLMILSTLSSALQIWQYIVQSVDISFKGYELEYAVFTTLFFSILGFIIWGGWYLAGINKSRPILCIKKQTRKPNDKIARWLASDKTGKLTNKM